MKQVVIALLITTINRYSDLKCDKNWLPKEMVINDLTGILDYVADIKVEESESNEVLNTFYEIVMENKNLNKMVRDLKEGCQHMCDVEKNQLEKMELLKAENEDLRTKLFKKGEI